MSLTEGKVIAKMTPGDSENMYDRDYVKKLEQEIELSGSNRFEGWRASTGKEDAGNAISPDQGRVPVEDPSRK